jgi:hypothetical protein
MTPSTPPEERETMEQTVTIMVDSIKTLEVECVKLYIDTMGVWTQLNEDGVQQNISKKIQTAQGKVQKLQEAMGTLPPKKVVTEMNEN